MSDMKFEQEFLQGQRDCKKGESHTGKSEAYYRGYAAQYTSDQIDTWRSQQEEKRHGY